MGAIVGRDIVGFIEAKDDSVIVGWAFNPASDEAVELRLMRGCI
jgi:hypothetical protein